MINFSKNYFYNIALGLDQLGTTLLGGYPDETMSSYAHRLRAQGKRFGFTANLIDKLFFWQKDHCRMAYESERVRRHMPPLLRD